MQTADKPARSMSENFPCSFLLPLQTHTSQ